MPKNHENQKDHPAKGAFSVTPSDTTLLRQTAIGIYIGVTGDLKVQMPDTSVVTFSSVPVGVMPIEVTQVFSTGTTATSIIALT